MSICYYSDVLDDGVQMETEEEQNRKRHLNVVFIGHVGKLDISCVLRSNLPLKSSVALMCCQVSVHANKILFNDTVQSNFNADH